MKVRPSFLVLLILSLLLLFVFSRMPPETRNQLLEALGVPKNISINGPLSPLLEAGKQQLEFVVEGFETHMTACYVPTTRSTAEVEPQGEVFKWTDAEGNVHFGDKMKGYKAENLSNRYKMQKQYFRMSIVAAGGSLPVFLHDRLSADLRQLYSILSRSLPDQYIKQVDLKVKVFNDQSQFDLYRNEHAPGLLGVSGFYKPSLDEAVVMVQLASGATRSIARHEATHVINAGLYGRTPIWFNEGLAEYFERLVVEGQSKRIDVAKTHLDLLKKGLMQKSLMTPQQYLAINGGAWREHEQPLMYAMAWSMVHFMMQDSLGKETMKSLVTHMAANYCQPVDTIAFIERNYVGGMKAFAERWRLAILSDSFHSHRY